MPSRDIDVIFAQQWAIYRKIIDADYMDHRAIAAALAGHYEQLASDSLSVLDLGCGDAEISSELVSTGRCRRFTGVDSSSRALEEAARRSVWNDTDASWVESDLLDFLRDSAERYDLILAGYSVHHLTQNQKREAFNAVYALLADGGSFFLYDVSLLPGLDHNESTGRYLEWVRSEWNSITAEEYRIIEEHIAAADFPESTDWMMEAARDVGFSECTLLPAPGNSFHQVMVFNR